MESLWALVGNEGVPPFLFLSNVSGEYDHFHSCRLSFSSLSCPAMDSSLEWLVRKVQLRIFLCALRRLIVKDANKSRLVYLLLLFFVIFILFMLSRLVIIVLFEKGLSLK